MPDGNRIVRFIDRMWAYLGLNWTIVSLSVARMGDGIGNSILFVIIPLYVVQMPEELFHLPQELMIGILISVYGFANAILQPFMAALSDRIGHYKRIIQAGLVFIGLATLGFIFANQYVDILGLRIAQGLGLAMEIPPTLALLGMMTEKKTRGSAMGFYTTLRMLGLAIGPLLGGFLHDHFGFTAAFLAGAAVLLLALFIVQLGVKNIAAPEQKCRSHVVDFSLLDRGILSAATATFLMATAFTLVTTLENEINARLGIGAFAFGIAFSALMVGRLMLQVPLGRLSDRYGRKPFVLCGLVAIAPLTVLLGEMTAFWQFILIRLAQGIAAGAIVAPALAFAGDIAEQGEAHNRSRQMSIVTMGFGLGIAFGPLMAGFLAIFFFKLPFWVDGALCLIGSLVVYLFMTETVERPRR